MFKMTDKSRSNESSTPAENVWKFISRKLSCFSAREEEPEPHQHDVPAEPEEVLENSCVYCGETLPEDDDFLQLTEYEARMVTQLCPVQFTKGRIKKHHEEPQDPNKICGMCTALLRIHLRFSALNLFRIKKTDQETTKTDEKTIFWGSRIYFKSSLLIILNGGTIMSEYFLWLYDERNPVIRTIVAFTRTLFNVAFCLERIVGLTGYEQLNVEPEDEVDERPCVYCNENFRENDAAPLTASEAQAVPILCPEHFNRGKKRTFYREPQNPRHICQECTLMLRTLINECHFTVWNPME
ncbi:Hypothetical predicted protein [Cloeon dipterum]|uniref:Uncharacterized protein n=1 Tax=Cloeon dipterum TaxID=197152 RepID=A0A8S1DUS7_9INSE|nr:Hypothetical predicted protein [Cloeon dipterum]